MKNNRKILKAIVIGIFISIMILPASQGYTVDKNNYKFGQPPAPPVANFHWTPEKPEPGEMITFNASDSFAVHPEYYIVSYEWDLDEDNICDDATGIITTCCHNCADLYDVTLTVTDSDGLSGTNTKTVDLRHPPNIPDITGPSTGKIGETCTYTITTEDQDDDKVYYKIDWGPKSTDWLGPYPSGRSITESYSWSKEGDYVIEVLAKDITEAESEVATLEVSMPKSKSFNMNIWFQKLLEKHPCLFPIFRQIMLLD